MDRIIARRILFCGGLDQAWCVPSVRRRFASTLGYRPLDVLASFAIQMEKEEETSTSCNLQRIAVDTAVLKTQLRSLDRRGQSALQHLAGVARAFMGFISSANTDAGSPRLHFTVCSARAALENEKGGLKKPPFEEFRDGPKRLLVHRNRRSIAACTKKHQNSQIHVCREKVSRRISQNNVRSAGMECIDFTLIGAIDRAK